MDKINKALKSLSDKERKIIKDILLKIKSLSWSGLDLKKLKGNDEIFRVRKGKIRIIFRKNKNEEVFILTVERRSDKTYQKY
jgi:mRNA-degrading endonuclease RelE of RelBE toxin-antitoxin system